MGTVIDPVDGFLAEMWERYGYLADQRVAALERYVEAGGGDRSGDVLADEAESAAHKLVGALGSYRRPGSEQAAVVERLVQSRAPLDDVAAAVRELRRLVG
ncbi:hypothetical protein [Cryobacterium gelidum]|uniref:Hpt domain-containing protein n=1 Tax=Cryobacterium gelidum TaxID=1259164 RepID=A0A4R9AWU3_9MICO|nr:hypothetical protein [Cryobacterium gelidum]TFD71527.1 hypothetical protein E3T50_08250 [Cryobacterium gelidum]